MLIELTFSDDNWIALNGYTILGKDDPIVAEIKKKLFYGDIFELEYDTETKQFKVVTNET